MSLIKSIGIYKLTPDVNPNEVLEIVGDPQFKDFQIDLGAVFSESLDIGSPEFLLMRELAAKRYPFATNFTTTARVRGKALESIIYNNYPAGAAEVFKQSPVIFDRVTLNIPDDTKQMSHRIKTLEHFRANLSQISYGIRTALLQTPENAGFIRNVLAAQQLPEGRKNAYELLHYPGDFDTEKFAWEVFLRAYEQNIPASAHEWCGNIGPHNVAAVLDLIYQYAPEQLRIASHEKLLTDGKTNLNEFYKLLNNACTWELFKSSRNQKG